MTLHEKSLTAGTVEAQAVLVVCEETTDFSARPQCSAVPASGQYLLTATAPGAMRPCRRCSGTGRVYGGDCPSCKGSGFKYRDTGDPAPRLPEVGWWPEGRYARPGVVGAAYPQVVFRECDMLPATRWIRLLSDSPVILLPAFNPIPFRPSAGRVLTPEERAAWDREHSWPKAPPTPTAQVLGAMYLEHKADRDLRRRIRRGYSSRRT
jgi:hypothetical protein